MRTWAMGTVVSRLRLAAGGVDDMAKVDAVQADAVAAAPQARMADDIGGGNPGETHENGAVDSHNRHLKIALDQASPAC